ncbi:MAG: hypothetical protein ABSE18_03245 [Minisyncoccia bacterium]|jgi:hypothetical protein
MRWKKNRTDIVATESIYEFSIAHVDSFLGKGFVPSVSALGSKVSEGKVSFGTDETAYESAYREGGSLLQAQLDTDVATMSA